MLRRRKLRVAVGMALLAAVLTLSFIVAGSVVAGQSKVGTEAEVFSLGVGNGPGQIGYVAASDENDAWGPGSFTVLKNGNVAVLDAANKRLLLVDQSGGLVTSIPYQDLGLLCPVDLCEWLGKLAIIDLNTVPKSLVIADLNTRSRVDSAELPDGLANSLPVLQPTSDGGLQLVTNMSEAHLLANGTTLHGKAAMQEALSAWDTPGVGEVALEQGALDGSVGPVVRLTRASDKAEVQRGISADGIDAQMVQSLGGSPGGNLLLETGYFVPDGDDVRTRSYIEELSRDSLETVASVTIPESDFYVWPSRYLSLDDKGRVWCMVPTKDEVSFRILTPTSGKPNVSSGSLARSLTRSLACAGSSLRSPFRSGQAAAAPPPWRYTTPWTRSNGLARAQSYDSGYSWNCSAYGAGSGSGRRPYWITGAGTYYMTPYCYGWWQTVPQILHCGPSGSRRAGNCTSTVYLNTFGIDCSGFVGRVWGLTDPLDGTWYGGNSYKPGTYHLATDRTLDRVISGDSLTYAPWVVSTMYFGDALVHYESGHGHAKVYDHAVTSDICYVYESTTEGIDRVIYRSQSWYALKSAHPTYHAYVSLHWTN
ncbi:MAG: hypothetical protein JXA57_19485 [Armatimonadetes bacterium]|nr:hypothetical protein [Armatimonadota bacterium]